MKAFKEVKDSNIDLLNQYVPIVKRVHGREHPEFIEVARVFESLSEKLGKDDFDNLDPLFMELREITSNYQVPSDTCESYEAVYVNLEILDKVYFSQ